MKCAFFRLGGSAGLALVVVFLGSCAVARQSRMPPPAPTDVELVAAADLSITVTWDASPGATSYNVYRATSSGLEGITPIANTSTTEYRDTGLSADPVYFYQVTAVNTVGESERTEEEASMTPPPVGTGGDVPGIPVGNSMVYYAADALLDGFEWFQLLSGWFPQVLPSPGSMSPGQLVTDMAYSPDGTMTFNNVVVPTSGVYTVDWRYAFDSGAFPGVTNRQMGLRVNDAVITHGERFPITGSFDDYHHSFLQVNLNAGVNSITLFAVSKHGVARVDQMTITPATASVPSEPTGLTAAVAQCPSIATLSWTASSSGDPTSYSVYRGTVSDGQDVIPIGTTTGAATSFTDAYVESGTTYFYSVVANNSIGPSPSSNEVALSIACAPAT
jgi:Fibronectin type III domain